MEIGPRGFSVMAVAIRAYIGTFGTQERRGPTYLRKVGRLVILAHLLVGGANGEYVHCHDAHGNRGELFSCFGNGWRSIMKASLISSGHVNKDGKARWKG